MSIKKVLVFAMFLCILIPTVSAQEIYTVLGEENDGETLVLDVGDEFSINVSENPSTGYGWFIDYDESLLELVSDETYTVLFEGEIYPPPGRGGTRNFTFKALKNGTSDITMDYIGPSSTSSPGGSLEYTIQIGDGLFALSGFTIPLCIAGIGIGSIIRKRRSK